MSSSWVRWKSNYGGLFRLQAAGRERREVRGECLSLSLLIYYEKKEKEKCDQLRVENAPSTNCSGREVT